MKRRIVLFLTFFIPLIIFAQNNPSDEKCVSDFFGYIEKYIPKAKNSLHKVINIPDPEYIQIRNTYHDAIALNPYGYKAKLNSLTAEWKKTGEKGVHPPIDLKPAHRIKMMKDKLADRYGEDYVKILSTPIIIKVLLKDITSSVYNSPTNKNLHANQTNLIVEIQEILKGKPHLNDGETITISYLDWWYEDNPISFNIGKSYLLPVEPWYGKNDDFNSLIIKDPSSSLNISEIDGDRIQSIYPNNSDQSISWIDFKTSFSEKYSIK